MPLFRLASRVLSPKIIYAAPSCHRYYSQTKQTLLSTVGCDHRLLARVAIADAPLQLIAQSEVKPLSRHILLLYFLALAHSRYSDTYAALANRHVVYADNNLPPCMQLHLSLLARHFTRQLRCTRTGTSTRTQQNHPVLRIFSPRRATLFRKRVRCNPFVYPDSNPSN